MPTLRVCEEQVPTAQLTIEISNYTQLLTYRVLQYTYQSLESLEFGCILYKGKSNEMYMDWLG